MNGLSTVSTAIRPNSIIKSQLQCLRDLVALSALPSIWTELRPTAIAESLADVLFRIIHVDLIYVRLKVSITAEVYEAARTRGHSKELDGLRRIRDAFAPWLEQRLSISPVTISNPIGAGRLRVLAVPIVQGSERGVVCVCSRLAEFPSEYDCLLANVACNHAVAVLSKPTASSTVCHPIAANPYRYELLRAVDYIKENLENDLSLNTIGKV